MFSNERSSELTSLPGEYKKNPYDYRESDTARRRAKKGPTEGGTNRPQQPREPRGKRETTTDPEDGGRQERPTIQSTTSSGGTPLSQYQAQYSQYSAHSQPQNVQTSAYGYHQQTRPDQGSGTNINITMNAAAFAPGRAGQPAQYPAQTYGNYALPAQQDPDAAPPPYQQSATSRGGGPAQPPGQPGPDTFDAEKPVTSRSQSAQDRRPSTYDPSTRRSDRRQ